MPLGECATNTTTVAATANATGSTVGIGIGIEFAIGIGIGIEFAIGIGIGIEFATGIGIGIGIGTAFCCRCCGRGRSKHSCGTWREFARTSFRGVLPTAFAFGALRRLGNVLRFVLGQCQHCRPQRLELAGPAVAHGVAAIRLILEQHPNGIQERDGAVDAAKQKQNQQPKNKSRTRTHTHPPTKHIQKVRAKSIFTNTIGG